MSLVTMSLRAIASPLAGKVAEKASRKAEGLCHLTGPFHFFYFLVYKCPLRVLGSEGQYFHTPEARLVTTAVSVQSEKEMCMHMDRTKFNRRFLKMLLKM